jgi:prepilin-type N-terminal cleavage/methylation domain-containing protein
LVNKNIKMKSSTPAQLHTCKSSSVFIRALNPCLSTNGFTLVEVLVVLSLMALLVFFLGSKINNIGEDWRFEKTCHMMEEIKEAIVGKPGLYCNGIKQFTGYVSDMGDLPSLFDEKGNKIEFIDENGNNVMDDNTLNDILQGKLIVQPRTLWTRDTNGDGENDIPDDVLWKYHEDSNIWAGWRGPYIDPPPGGVFRDAWGNAFVFFTGELVTHNGKTYRCVKTHQAGLGKAIDPKAIEEPHEPGTKDGEKYWKELPVHINAKTWVWPGKNVENRDRPHITDVFYGDAMVVISYGKDGEPGGERLGKDSVIIIYRQEWTGEVSGHAGYRGNQYVDAVTLHYPKEGKIENAPIEIVDNDHGSDIGGETIYCGINFRFGIAPMATGICLRWEQQCQEYDDSGDNCIEYLDVCIEHELTYKPKPDSNWKKVAVPIGIRSLQAGGENYIFPVEATGNWVGTIK